MESDSNESKAAAIVSSLSESEIIAREALNELRYKSQPKEDKVCESSSAPNEEAKSINAKPNLKRKIGSSSKKLNVPTLPQDDVRHSYAKYYFDAVNSGDKTVILKALQSIAVPEVVLVSTFSVPVAGTDSFMPNHVEIFGMEAIATTCAEVVKSAPDVVLQLLSKQLQPLPEGESLLVCRCSMKGTKMFALTGCKEGMEKVVLTAVSGAAAGSNSSSSSGAGGDVSNMNSSKLTAKVTNLKRDPVSGKEVEVSSEEVFGLGDAAENSRRITAISTTTFHINAEKRVYRIASVKEVIQST